MRVDIEAFERESKRELMEEWKPEMKAEILRDASPAERLRGLTVEQILDAMPESELEKIRRTLARLPKD